MDWLDALGDSAHRDRLYRSLLTAQKAALLFNRTNDSRTLLAAAQVLGAQSRETRWLGVFVAELCRDYETGRRLFDELQARGEDVSPVRQPLAGCLRAVADPRWESLLNGLI